MDYFQPLNKNVLQGGRELISSYIFPKKTKFLRNN